MFGLFVFVVSLQADINVSNHLDRADCMVAAAAIEITASLTVLLTHLARQVGVIKS